MKNFKRSFFLIHILFTSQSIQAYAAQTEPANNDYLLPDNENYQKKAHNNSGLKFDLSKCFNIKAGMASFSIEYNNWENKNEIRDYSFFDTEQRPLNLFLNFRF